MDIDIVRDKVLDLQRLKGMAENRLVFSLEDEYITVKEISYKDGRVYINKKPLTSYAFLSMFHGAFFHIKKDVNEKAAMEVLDRLCVGKTTFYFGDEEVVASLLYGEQTEEDKRELGSLFVFEEQNTEEIYKKYHDMTYWDFVSNITGFCEVM